MLVREPPQSVGLAPPHDVNDGDDILLPAHDHTQVCSETQGIQLALISRKSFQTTISRTVPPG